MAKNNGCKCPFHPFQYFGIALTVFDLITFLTCVSPYLDSSQFLLFYVGFFLTYVAFVVPSVVLTFTDPTASAFVLCYPDSDVMHFCESCCIYVGENTKHCKICNRCVDDFDHHCKWLNNCIGKKNYKLFITVILFLEVFLALFFAMLVDVLIHNDEILEDLLVSIVILSCISVQAIIAVLNGYLIVFHSYLICKGMTTYQYIVSLRKEVARVASMDLEHTEHFTNRKFVFAE